MSISFIINKDTQTLAGTYCKVYRLLRLQRHAKVVCMTQVLPWVDTGFLSEVGELSIHLNVMGDQDVDSLWVKIRKETNTGDMMVGICQRPHDQEEKLMGTFFNNWKKSHISRPQLS